MSRLEVLTSKKQPIIKLYLLSSSLETNLLLSSQRKKQPKKERTAYCLLHSLKESVSSSVSHSRHQNQ
uniref:Uncharacterized protein n=1 Tax=Medicago truncatula TaxID=3880 RepID=B7FHP7_MEDTR|nr:unknown [Medicago truncatula]